MSGAARNRLLSAVAAAATASGMIAMVGRPERRLVVAYAVIATVGYGHLLGAARPLERMRRWTPPGVSPWLLAAFVANGIATVFVAYRALLAVEPRAIALLFTLSAWHTWENDRALGATYARRGTSGPTRASPWSALAMLGGAVALGPLLFGVTGSGFEVAVFVVPTAYHLASWLVITVDRRRWLRQEGRRAAARRLGRRLVGCHAAALLPAALLLLAPGSGAAGLAGTVLSLPVYLFATALHILDTAAGRGWQPTPAADAA